LQSIANNRVGKAIRQTGYTPENLKEFTAQANSR
jgi:hypothetical protein